MGSALGWGVLAAASLVIGAVLALVRRWSGGVVGAVLAFGAGALISSVSFELAQESLQIGGPIGVSRALVSIVFRGAEGASDETRRRVLETAAEVGYRPDSLARGLRRHRSKNLGVLFSLRRSR